MTRDALNGYHGILLIAKPAGPTSHDVVDVVRRVLRQRRVGHLGTLDPMAEGVLPLALGLATRLASILVHADKVYEAVFRFGVETDTHDRAGRVIAEHPVPDDLTEDRLREVLRRYVGEIDQVPPLISAKKYRGRPLYWWVRRGKEVPPPPPKRVRFYVIDLITWVPPYAHLKIHCSAGAYIRALARDVGQAVGCGAIVDRIRRIRWGRYSLEDTIPLARFREQPELRPPYFIPLEDIAPEWPRLRANPVILRRLLSGQSVPLPPLMRQIEGVERLTRERYLKVFSPQGKIVAIAEIDYPNWIRPNINFPQRMESVL